MPTPLDIAFAVLFAVFIPLLLGFYFNPRFKRAVAAGVPNARRREYRRTSIGQWVLAAVTILVWARSARPWRRLWLAPAHDWRIAVGLVLVAVVAVVMVRQTLAVRRLSNEKLDALRPRLTSMEFMLPTTPDEYRWFVILSFTAGFCEELLYRGFLTWLVSVYVGLLAAIVLVALAFGLAHAYQGRQGVLKTSVAGLVMGLMVVASGWLVPAMVIHAIVDVGSGAVGYAVLGPRRDAREGVG